jgi:hypothetical protein
VNAEDLLFFADEEFNDISVECLDAMLVSASKDFEMSLTL